MLVLVAEVGGGWALVGKSVFLNPKKAVTMLARAVRNFPGQRSHGDFIAFLALSQGASSNALASRECKVACMWKTTEEVPEIVLELRMFPRRSRTRVEGMSRHTFSLPSLPLFPPTFGSKAPRACGCGS